MIVGLDISTSVVGLCILNEDGSFYDIDHLDLKKESNFYKKVDLFKEFITRKTKNLSNLHFFVEESLMMHNKSMAQVLSLLQRFNACCCFQIYSVFGCEPKLLNVLAARKCAGVSIPKEVKKAKGTKQYIFEYVKSLEVVPTYNWVYKKTGKPKDFCYDMADAFIVARASYEENCKKTKESSS